MASQSILIVAAHPDDDVLGCGGTIARHAAAGDAVRVLFVADGVGARANAEMRRELLATRREAACLALAALGVSAVPIFLDFEDQRLDAVPLLDITQAIERVAENVMPQIVYTHHQGDLNLDHRLVSQATQTAFRPVPGQSARRLYAFETLSSTEWASGRTGEAFLPSYFVDITSTFEKKMAALRAYSKEMREFPHARSYASVEALASLRGATVGLARAEAFSLIREIVA